MIVNDTRAVRIGIFLILISAILIIISIAIYMVTRKNMGFNSIVQYKKQLDYLLEDCHKDFEGVDLRTIGKESYLIERLSKWEDKLNDAIEPDNKIFIDVRAYGAKGDGMTNDSRAIQAAVIDASRRGGGIVYIPRGKEKYILNSPIVMKSNVHILSDGAILDISNAQKITGYRYAIKASGEIGNPIGIKGAVKKGDMGCELETVSGLKQGDYVQLYSSTDYYPYDFNYNVERGEIKLVRYIENNTIYFDEAIYDDYDPNKICHIRKIKFIEDISVRGVKIKGDREPDDNEMGISFQYVNGFDISDNEIEDADLYLIELSSCIRGSVYNNRVRCSFYDGVRGVIFYGIAVLDSTQWVRIHDNYGERIRHLVVTSSRSAGQGFWGQPRFIAVNGNIAKDLMAGGQGRSYAYEHHGSGEDIIFDGNMADGCYSGFNIEGSNVAVTNNIVMNYGVAGITIERDALKVDNILIANNLIGNPTGNEYPGQAPIGIWIDFNEGAMTGDITITGNVLVSNSNPVTGLKIGGGVRGDRFTISNNLFYNHNRINISCPGVIIEGNNFYGPSEMININAADCIVINNIFRVSNGAVTVSEGENTVITGNIFENTDQAIRLNNDGTGNMVCNNVVKQGTRAMEDGIHSPSITRVLP